MRRALISSVALIAFHLLAWVYVAANDVQYDQRGVQGLLWWLVAFLVLPAIAAVVLVVGVIKRWSQVREGKF